MLASIDNIAQITNRKRAGTEHTGGIRKYWRRSALDEIA
jgi:hypothetical protein